MNSFTLDLLQQSRQVGDPLADKVINQLFADKESAQQLRAILGKPTLNNSPLPNLPDYLTSYFETSKHLPKWADVSLLKQGNQFFEANAREIMALLGYLSLPYCYAAGDGARVLWLSERIKKNTAVRLAETAQFIFDVMAEDAFQPTGYGIRSIQKVRLIHAAIRYHVTKSGKWNSEQWGLPVNQEDMAGTNLAFSLIILRGLRKMGKSVSLEDSEAYLHYWKVIGSMLGIIPELIPENGKAAFWLEKKIAQRTIRQSFEGQALTKVLLESFDIDPPITLPDGFHASFMRFVLGDSIADILGLPPSNWTRFMVKPQKYINVLMSTFETAKNSANAKKKLSFLKHNILERISYNKGFEIPSELS